MNKDLLQDGKKMVYCRTLKLWRARALRGPFIQALFQDGSREGANYR